MKTVKQIVLFLVFLLVALLTQVGGIAFVICWIVARWALGRFDGVKRIAANLFLFSIVYALLHVFVVPSVAAHYGRVPLPCFAGQDRPFKAASPLFCVLDRNYVDPRLVALLTTLAREMERRFPGTVTVYLDANFPFVNGFPLLPHLSHSDGRKLDIAYYYATPDGTYLAGRMRSPIGYWGFEQPDNTDTSPCVKESRLSLRWNMSMLQPLYPDVKLERDRTRAALDWLLHDGQAFGVQRLFIEPYLAKRLGVSSPILGFQGCRAARHDDHIHIQIAK